MRHYIVIIGIMMLAAGCRQGEDAKRPVLAKVNNYEITANEFEDEFKISMFGKDDTLASREAFLDMLINRKLILQDAQKRDMDKDGDFLKMVERFWEQSLLKLAIDKKSHELIMSSAAVSEDDIKKAYDIMMQEGKTDKPYQDMYKQIRQDLLKAKESEMMNKWMAGLRNKACITVHKELLKK